MTCEDYLKDISRAPLLTSDEEIVLGNNVQKMMRLLKKKGVTHQLSASNLNEALELLDEREKRIVRNGLKARNRMVSANMRLVVAIAKKYVARQVHMKMQDLIQEGAIGLTRAAEKFDPARGYKFSTYAYLWIKQGMTRGCEAQEGTIRLPAHLQRVIKKAAETQSRLTARLGREPTVSELLDGIGEADRDKLKKIVSTYRLVSLSCGSTDIRPRDHADSTLSLIDIINPDDESDARESEEDASKLDFIMFAIQALDPIDRELIIRKYGINCELASAKELAEITGLAPQVVKERQEIATAKIRYIVTSFAAPTT